MTTSVSMLFVYRGICHLAMNLLFLSVIALLFGLKWVVAPPPPPSAQPTSSQDIFNGIGVQVFITGLTQSTSYIIALQDAADSATVTYSSMTIDTLSGTSIFTILPIPYNAATSGSYYVNILDSDGFDLGGSGTAVIMNALTLPLFPSFPGNNYQLEQTISLPFLVNNGTNLNIQGCFAFTSTHSSATTSGPCFPATFSQNASAYVGAGSTETDATGNYIHLGTGNDSSVEAQVFYVAYAQPAVQSSRIPRSLLSVLP